MEVGSASIPTTPCWVGVEASVIGRRDLSLGTGQEMFVKFKSAGTGISGGCSPLVNTKKYLEDDNLEAR